MENNWWIEKKRLERKIKELVPNMENRAGIYVWYRKQYKFYAGQSVKLIDRSVAHLMQYDHLGRSIQKYGLYSKDNPWGWNLIYFYCDEWELDEKEREAIAKWCEHNISYNITSGGQNEGKVDINQRQAPKGYRDGLVNGYLKCRKEIRELFEKYLDFKMKEPYINKNGKVDKIKQKKYDKFVEFLKIGEK